MSYPPPPPPSFSPGYAEQPRTAGKATGALVVALAGFLVCAPLGGVIALILAASAAREIRASNGQLTGEGLVTAARIIGAIGVAVGVLALLAILAIAFLGGPAQEPELQSQIEDTRRKVLATSAAGS